MNTGAYREALSIIRNKLNQNKNDESKKGIFEKAQLHFVLIDIGTETNNKQLIVEGLAFNTQNESKVMRVISKSSYYYNIANAKSELGKLFYRENPGVHSFKVSRERFQEPIDLYWLSLKHVEPHNTELRCQILINLSNALTINFRFIEAIQLLDTVLKINESFPQALVSKADHLLQMAKITNSPVTAALYATIYDLYDKAVRLQIPPFAVQKCIHGIRQAKSKLDEYDFNLSDLDKEFSISLAEYNNHSDFRKFCIDNFLTLNEHTIYCSCSSSGKDDLQIGGFKLILNGELIPKLELLLNRVKSEFAFARWNYYRSLKEEAFDYDVIFSDLYDNEIINSQSETLRTSFRVCYGILDKIALGICKLYNITDGNIYFERFWDDKNRVSILENRKNIHLNALSSIANDLNSKRGELKHFKKWRNKLEHNLFILQDSNKLNLDPFELISDDKFVEAVDINEFKSATLHLLQLTRAAIFSLVYCIRLETVTRLKNDGKIPLIKIDTK
ncbi:MAG: hypothetical protein LBE37_16540 [Sphingobacterium sp.]|jgi:hypothetical protein|nr:hypothetical protein [Sphingobacterium sp.]